MAVSATNPVTNNTTTNNTSNTNSANKAASMNYNAFLQLLIAQMKNQDPTAPMDATQQVAQLATFSQVEQSLKMNKNLESLIQAQGLGQASSLLGKTVTSADGSVSGLIKEVQIKSDGVYAVTKDDKKILVESGIKIANAT